MALTDVNFDNLVIESWDTVTYLDKSDGSLLFLLDQVTDGTLDIGQETSYSLGKSGVKLSSLDKNASTKVSVTNGFVVFSAFAAQAGGDIEIADATNKFTIPKVEFITVNDPTKITLNETPVGQLGNEIPFIYKANRDKTQGESFSIAATESTTEFALSGDEITLPTGVFVKGDIVIVPYNREVATSKRFVKTADKFSKTGHAIFDITCRATCNNSVVYHVVIDMPNAKLDGNVSLAIGNEPTKHPLTFEALLDICSVDRELFTYSIV